MMLAWLCSERARETGLPWAFSTVSPPFFEDDVPLEATVLLPSGLGNEGLLRAIRSGPGARHGGGVGLFLNDPFLNVPNVIAELKNCSVTWVANLPSVAQHDPAFQEQLRDVGFTMSRELDVLAQFRAGGLKTLAVVSAPEHCASLAGQPTDALLRIPTTSDIQISFPSEAQRLTAANEIVAALEECGQKTPVLYMVTKAEFSRVDAAAMCRPVPAQPDSPQDLILL